MADNFDDVCLQLTGAGLILPETIAFGRMVRCKVEGDREKRGWFSLHRMRLESGDDLVVGSYGIWRGDNANATKVEVRKTALTAEQRESVRKRLAADRRQADVLRQQQADAAAARAAAAWAACLPDGESSYLVRKRVGAHGIRFSPTGALVIPMTDIAGRVRGLQIIRSEKSKNADRRPAKEYWPPGMGKKGLFHLLGVPTDVILEAEGYSTGATLFEQTGRAVAIAFDAGNLAPVAAALHRRYKTARILICADDDNFAECTECKARLVLTEHPTDCPECGQPHRRANAGVVAASAAAMEVAGAWMYPTFHDAARRRTTFIERGVKLSDFNDLAIEETGRAVGEQIHARIAGLGWLTRSSARAESNHNGTGGPPLRPITSLDELLERFTTVYGQGGQVFDREEHMLLPDTDMRAICLDRTIYRTWSEHPDRSIVRVVDVGFDPGGEDPRVTCNLWGGWPTKPKAGRCVKLLELLEYMCSAEQNSKPLYDWVIRWVAYPIQHHGAKMRSTLVLHGPQGTGKNLFFEALLEIYGLYGRVIDQAAIEDKFNMWASKKLFLIADEVVGRSDLYHVKNKLKSFITGKRLRINPKNMADFEEANHVNLVFLSNEVVPVVLEADDRRHTVIWTPEKLGPDFYQEVQDEIDNGGVAALHDYLLHLDLGDFRETTLPPWTDAKRELVGLSLDSTDRFYLAFIEQDVGGIVLRPALTEDFYELYKLWCSRVGARAAPMNRLMNVLKRRHKVELTRKRYELGIGIKGPHGCLTWGLEAPPGISEPKWLGEHVDSFRNAVKDYRAAAHA